MLKQNPADSLRSIASGEEPLTYAMWLKSSVNSSWRHKKTAENTRYSHYFDAGLEELCWRCWARVLWLSLSLWSEEQERQRGSADGTLSVIMSLQESWAVYLTHQRYTEQFREKIESVTHLFIYLFTLVKKCEALLHREKECHHSAECFSPYVNHTHYPISSVHRPTYGKNGSMNSCQLQILFKSPHNSITHLHPIIELVFWHQSDSVCTCMCLYGWHGGSWHLVWLQVLESRYAVEHRGATARKGTRKLHGRSLKIHIETDTDFFIFYSVSLQTLF